MSSEEPQNQNQNTVGQTPPAARIEAEPVVDEMEESYVDYSMSVIAGRALPDVRDGLKPVHRRILYSMSKDRLGVTSNSSHQKSANIVGETMGKFHPHGDSAIYDTLVRMAQEFNMRHCLVDGQGNFGSVDGDPAAAMRYTESRMTPLAEELLEDIGKETVNFQSNYDDRLQEPEVLPSSFPNLLVNGSSGIAVGMSTNIPPHNLGEVIDATTHLIDNPECDVEDLMEYVKGPDFPTGATIVGRDGIHSAYKTGRGKVRVRADFEVEYAENGRDKIIITELPFQENKARLIERIADDVKDEKLEGIADIRDESDRDGIRVVITTKKKAMTDVVKNQLLDSHLVNTFGIINLAIVDGEPRVLTLKETLEEYVAHRKEVVTRRTEHDLGDAEDRAHILEGRLTALDNADDVVDLIQDSENRDDAITALEDEYDFSTDQAEHIVRMQLGSLTSMEAGEIEEEYEEVEATIERLTNILENEGELHAVIKDELNTLKDEYADERRTSIIEGSGDVEHEDLIPEEDIVIALTEEDYLKRMPADEFASQHRGGKGVIGADLKDGDQIAEVFAMNTHDYLLVFTNHGQVYQLKGYEIPEFGRTARGTPAVSIIPLDDGERITALVDADELDEETYVSMITEDGYIKRTAGDEFENILSTGIRAVTLEDDDRLVDVAVSDGGMDFLVGTKNGMSIRFDESEVRAMGRTARGVNSIRLDDEDSISGLVTINGHATDLLTITENGYGKRTDLSEYPTQSRNGKGVMDIKTSDRNGQVASVEGVDDDDEIIGMSRSGKIIRLPLSEVSSIGRNTQGVTIMDLESDDSVASVDVAPTGDAADSDSDE